MINAMGTRSKMITNIGANGGETSSELRNQWYFQSRRCEDVCHDADINIVDAWTISKGDPNITIAILDAEVDASNEISQHGILCAQLAAGKFGVAPECSSMLVKIPLQASDDLLIQILEQTSCSADVICCSWSATPVYKPLSANLYRCLSNIASDGGPTKNGCVICFAAGNCNAPVKDLDNKEFVWLDETIDFIRVTKGPIENGFASHPDVITVAACTSLNQKANYSNWGNEIDLCAPSNNFHPFSKTFRVDGIRSIDVPIKMGDETVTRSFGGTSAATALVAGVAALTKSANPKLSASEIRRILQEAADKIVDETINAVDKNKWFGYGKVNAGKAVMIANKILTDD
jgi:subtilisin family serine protease